MKKNILIVCIFAIFINLIATSCSNEERVEPIDYDNLQYVVNVTKGDDTTSVHRIRSKAKSKKGWEINDCIYMSADGNLSNVYKITYDGADWRVEKVINEAKFNGTSGKVNAVYTDKSSYKSADEIDIQGDILYTDEGTYSIEDNIVFINLRMNKRPVSRIEIQGIEEGFIIEELKNYSSVKLGALNWIENTGRYTGVKEKGNIVYYGIMPKNNEGNYTITLNNNDGLTYSRTYISKTLSEGEQILVFGPNSDEKDLWTLKGTIKTLKESLNLPLAFTGKISELYEIIPANATNKDVDVKSSNESIVKINPDGTYNTIGIGEATITISTKDGDSSSQTKVNVKDGSELATVKLTGLTTSGIVVGGWSQISYGATYTIYNNSDIQIKAISIGTSSQTIQLNEITIEPNSTTNVNLSFNNTNPNDITIYVKIEILGKEYTIHT